jgi:hypothetical protein
MNNTREWSNAGGCGIWCGKDCCQARIDAGLNLDGSSKTDDESDLLLAQAMLEAQRKEDKSWTATQTVAVIGGSLLGIALLVIVIKKIKNKKRG